MQLRSQTNEYSRKFKKNQRSTRPDDNKSGTVKKKQSTGQSETKDVVMEEVVADDVESDDEDASGDCICSTLLGFNCEAFHPQPDDTDLVTDQSTGKKWPAFLWCHNCKCASRQLWFCHVMGCKSLPEDWHGMACAEQHPAGLNTCGPKCNLWSKSVEEEEEEEEEEAEQPAAAVSKPPAPPGPQGVVVGKVVYYLALKSEVKDQQKHLHLGPNLSDAYIIARQAAYMRLALEMRKMQGVSLSAEEDESTLADIKQLYAAKRTTELLEMVDYTIVERSA